MADREVPVNGSQRLLQYATNNREKESMNMNHISDAEIIEYGKMISILSNRMISDKEAAKEAAQEVWAEVFQSLPSFRNESRLSTWIYSVAKRVIGKYAVHERHYSTAFLHGYITGDDRGFPDDISDPEKRAWIREECDRCLTGLFHCLTNDARMIYLFRDVIQLPYSEIARIMDMDEPGIRKVISRSRAKLRSFLNNECRIFNPASKCKCRMHALLEQINLPEEYQRIRDLGKHVSIFRQADMILPSKNYWEKYSLIVR